MTKFCTSCGAALELDSRFCVACAAPVTAPGAVESAPARPAPAPARAPSANSAPTAKVPEKVSATRSAAPAYPASPKSRIGGAPLFVAIAVMAAIALGGTGYWAWTKKQEADALARQVEETRVAGAKRKEEGAAGREQELRQKMKEEEDRGQEEGKDRRDAETSAVPGGPA